MTLAEGSGGVEEPIEDLPDLTRLRLIAKALEVTIGVLDRTRQDVQIIPESLELRLHDDEFVVAQLQLTRSLTRHPVPLSTRLTAELPRSTRSVALREDPPAPSTSTDRRFGSDVGPHPLGSSGLT